MRKNRLAAISLILVFFVYWLSVPVAFAVDRNSSAAGAGSAAESMSNSRVSVGSGNPERGVTIGDSGSPSIPVQDIDSASDNRDPVIEEVNVLGDFNRSAKGISYFKDITISLVADNLTDDNFLSPEGLHWSSRTGVELIKGQILGDFDFSVFPRDVPKARVKAFRINDGDSGRITYVGRTRSGIDLDLIWTVTGSDKEDWAAHSGYANSKVKGLGFTGEQFFPGARGNSIAVLYDNASNLGLRYQIVKHGTFVEQPVVVSFISTDIDSAQGVETDLANLVEVIPPDSHLVKKDGIIYDTTRGVVNLKGSAALPRGGYLGAGFLSSFNYVFYSPAPQRVNNSYHYPKAVRYDIFGSSLQAKITPRLRQHISVSYVDTSGRELKPEERFKGYTGESYRFSAPGIDKYQLAAVEKDVSDIYRPRVRFIYSPIKASSSHQIGNPGSYPTYSKHSSSAVAGRKSVARSPQLKREVRRFSASKPASKALSANREPMRRQGKVANNSAAHGASDPFLVNTGMTAAEKRLFLDYVEEMGRQARRKYGSDTHKINHFIANAIAYPVYKDDPLQSRVNDFGEEPKVKNYGKIYDALKAIHGYSKYTIDFPHFATTLASAEKSSPNKERLKLLAGLSPSVLLGVSRSDNFFQLNSLTGDLLTKIDSKDLNTDIDAIIFHYHPSFKNLPLDKLLIKYYHRHNLNSERQRLYREVLAQQAYPFVSPKTQERLNILFATMTLGALALVGIKLFLEFEKLFSEFKQKKLKQWEEFKSSIGFVEHNRFKRTVLGLLPFLFHPNEKRLLSHADTKVIKSTRFSVKKSILKPVVRKVIKPGVRWAKKIVRSLYSRVIKRSIHYIKHKIVKPVVKKIKRRIIKPLYRRIIKPLYRKVIKPFYRRIVKPIYKKIIKPVYNKVIKSVVKNIFKKVIRPTARFVRNKMVKPTKCFVKNKILKPAKRLFRWLRG
ncbi:MucBP domain-containing protein [uncultured Varibaculum sp.]|uniref:MucBP domain-containing protein n=1 Tax=uncultured Varibaculum sp. TaxID=413896 RepID=UPI00258DBCD4|nr:MucBP domain-containing protein [uncultured Varibaculum sp.]